MSSVMHTSGVSLFDLFSKICSEAPIVLVFYFPLCAMGTWSFTAERGKKREIKGGVLLTYDYHHTHMYMMSLARYIHIPIERE